MDSANKSWIRFEKSGKLSDYLLFCRERRMAEARKKPEARPESEPSTGYEPDQSSL